jgi:hypothetical protein
VSKILEEESNVLNLYGKIVDMMICVNKKSSETREREKEIERSFHDFQ